jgi:hypothetical protein
MSKKHDYGYCTIGLENRWPQGGFNSCDEYGVMGDPFPHPMDKRYMGKYVFADEESREAFLGETILDDGLHFAVVKYVPNEQTKEVV